MYFLPFSGIRSGARQPVGPLNACRHSFSVIKKAPFAFCFLEFFFRAAGFKEPKR